MITNIILFFNSKFKSLLNNKLIKKITTKIYINKLINIHKHSISMEEGQLFIFKQREPGGDLFLGGQMSGRNGTTDLRLVKPISLTKKKLKYNFGNSVYIINENLKQLKHNILLLERFKKMKLS